MPPNDTPAAIAPPPQMPAWAPLALMALGSLGGLKYGNKYSSWNFGAPFRALGDYGGFMAQTQIQQAAFEQERKKLMAMQEGFAERERKRVQSEWDVATTPGPPTALPEGIQGPPTPGKSPWEEALEGKAESLRQLPPSLRESAGKFLMEKPLKERALDIQATQAEALADYRKKRGEYVNVPDVGLVRLSDLEGVRSGAMEGSPTTPAGPPGVVVPKPTVDKSGFTKSFDTVARELGYNPLAMTSEQIARTNKVIQDRKIDVAESMSGIRQREAATKPPTLSERKEVGKLQFLDNTAKELATANLDELVGPVQGRLNELRLATPGVEVSPEVGRFHAQMASLRNLYINALSGTAVGEKEAERMDQQFPKWNDKPELYRQKLAVTRENIAEMQKAMAEGLTWEEYRTKGSSKGSLKAPPSESGAPASSASRPGALWKNPEFQSAYEKAMSMLKTPNDVAAAKQDIANTAKPFTSIQRMAIQQAIRDFSERGQ